MTSELLQKRARFIQTLRNYFIEKNYLEVETPLLAPFLIPEPCLEIFKTQFLTPQKQPVPLYLIPSPELWMKRLLAEGSGNIFQICKCFRNGELPSRIHNLEFTMLEWYTVDSNYYHAMKQIEDLLFYLVEVLKISSPKSILGEEVYLKPPFLQLSMNNAFINTLKFTLDTVQNIGALKAQAGKHGITVSSKDSWEQIFNKLFLTFIEPDLAKHKPVLLFDYPKQIPTLAKIKSGTPYVQRWELYIAGVEIANCYTEETNFQTVEKFFKSESIRKQKCRVRHKIDWQFADYFKKDFPACSGVALGVDRLFMVLHGFTSLSNSKYNFFQ